jgi:FAD/FMN-containing dehydrogenase
VVVGAELSLVRRPAREIGLAIPFSEEGRALQFVVAARERTDSRAGPHAECLEYFDGEALAIARDHLGAPRWMDGASALVYLEQAFATEEEQAIDQMLDAWLALAEQFGAAPGAIEAYDDAAALRAARRFRHAVPAYMNERGAARRPYGGRKVSTDWAVPYRRLPQALDASRRAIEAAGVSPPVTYGHAGNGHPHQNFIAYDADELARVIGAVDETIHAVLGLGGTVAAEHGLGKLKRQWLHAQLSPLQIDVMRAMKATLDPHGLFAPGNVFPPG